jgi:hypothetical protein
MVAENTGTPTHGGSKILIWAKLNWVMYEFYSLLS